MSGTREIGESVKCERERRRTGTGKGRAIVKERQREGKRRYNAAGHEKASVVRRSEIRFEGKGK